MTELTDRPVDSDPDFDPDDMSSNPSIAPHFADVVEARMSRRTVLRGGMLAAAGFMTTRLVTDTPEAYAAPKGKPGKPVPAPAGGGLLGFQAIAPSTLDEVVVPAGYTAVPFIPWGTPLRPNGPAFVPGSPDIIGTGNTAAEQEQQVGMHHDGMHFFPFGRGGDVNRRGLLVVNHEYTDEFYLHTGTKTRPAPGDYTLEMVRKSQAAHGASVLEVRESRRGKWKVMPSKLNRRITANTPMTSRAARRAARCWTPASLRTEPARSARSTTARTVSRPGTPTSPAKRTSTATSRSSPARTTRTTPRSRSVTASAGTVLTGRRTTRASW